MSLPTKQKIANQLFFKVLSIYLTILAVVLLSLSVIAFDNEKQKIKQELSLLGQKGAIELSEPLWFFDEEQIKGKVESLQKNNFVHWCPNVEEVKLT